MLTTDDVKAKHGIHNCEEHQEDKAAAILARISIVLCTPITENLIEDIAE